MDINTKILNKKSKMMKNFIGLFFVTFLAKANGDCIFSGAYSDAAKYSIKFTPGVPICNVKKKNLKKYIIF